MTKEEWKHLPLVIFKFTAAPQDLGLLIVLCSRSTSAQRILGDEEIGKTVLETSTTL